MSTIGVSTFIFIDKLSKKTDRVGIQYLEQYEDLFTFQTTCCIRAGGKNSSKKSYLFKVGGVEAARRSVED